MPNKDIIVIGASTGGIEALKEVVAAVPAGFPASIFVVVHIGAFGLGVLPEILQRAGKLPAKNARDWDEIKPGHIYVAPPDHHLLVDRRGYTRVTRGPKENLCRPAIDPLFRSAALSFGSRVIGVVLTGYLDDGTAGLWAIKERGGTVIVQDPEDALARSMPESALRHVAVDHVVTLRKLAPLLVELTRTPATEKGGKPVSDRMETEFKIAQEDKALESGITSMGEPSIFACPECHGVLLEIKEGSNIRFRCHTGHAFSIETLLADFTEQNEDAMWSAIRSIEESAMLMRRMAAHLDAHRHDQAAATLIRKADEAQKRADLVRQAVMSHERLGSPAAGEPQSASSNGEPSMA